ncbi:ion channel [Zhongshania guokunii]|uniref:Ion channel n=1 Tax=Zhongshania guokunii TaxID=641783 RepID=A0ABV3U8A7_9GAMM
MIYIFLINTIVVALSVIVHYEFLYRITLHIPRMNIAHRYRIVIGVFGSLIAHALEIWIFAVAYYFMNRADGWGHLEGNFNGSLMDCGYFSFTVFTTLGFGDIQPNGGLRYLTGIESLTGLVLITWTASFLYFEMQRHWGDETKL